MKSLLLAAASVMIATSAHAWASEDKGSTIPPQQAKQAEPLSNPTTAVLAATAAQHETIYITPGTVVHWQTKRPFKTAISGNDELLVVHPGATNQDLIIVASQPDGTLTASAAVLMMDDHGELVQNLHVIVTPFGGPSTTVRVVRGGNVTTYQCSSHQCIGANAATSHKKGMGDADGVTETRHEDGSTGGSTPSTPPTS